MKLSLSIIIVLELLSVVQCKVCHKHKISHIVNLNKEQQNKLYYEAVVNCSLLMASEQYPNTGLHCNITFDSVMCWPYTPAGTVAVQRCPSYLHGSNTQAVASRYCLPNGNWYFHEAINNTWTDYTACFIPTPSLIEKHLYKIQTLYHVGYSMSLVCLVIAVILMLICKNLYCQRIAIHVNLFVSFILRSVICLVKDIELIPPGDVVFQNKTVIHHSNSTNWRCKFVFTLFQYFLTCNYTWIFMEGLYLYTLIFAVFHTKNLLKFYLVGGWGCPLLCIIPWVLVRLNSEDTLCWNTHDQDNGYYWMIKAPIVTVIIVNFFFFVNIIRVLFTKLTAINTRNPERYKKLAKSTLVLIPLFGVYYIVFICIPDCLEDNQQIIRFYIEMVFNSFQGVVVAVLFCFLNGEVQSEIYKKWTHQSLRRKSLMSTRASSIGSSFFVKDRSPSGVQNDVIHLKQLHNNDAGKTESKDCVDNGKCSITENIKFTPRTVKYTKIKRNQSAPVLRRNESTLSNSFNFSDG